LIKLLLLNAILGKMPINNVRLCLVLLDVQWLFLHILKNTMLLECAFWPRDRGVGWHE